MSEKEAAELTSWGFSGLAASSGLAPATLFLRFLVPPGDSSSDRSGLFNIDRMVELHDAEGESNSLQRLPFGGKKEIRVSLKYTDLNGKEDRPWTSCDGLRSSHSKLGFPGGASGKEPVCQCRRHKKFGFDLWVRKILWRRAWQPTPVLLPGEFHGQRSLVGCSPWGCYESDTTERTP